MKLSNNHWDNTEDDDTFEEQPDKKGRFESYRTEWDYESTISFKALAWGAGLTVAVVLLGLKVYSLFQR